MHDKENPARARGTFERGGNGGDKESKQEKLRKRAVPFDHLRRRFANRRCKLDAEVARKEGERGKKTGEQDQTMCKRPCSMRKRTGTVRERPPAK